MSVTYRKINPSSDEDIKIYFEMRKELNNYLSTNCSEPTEEIIKWQRLRMGAAEFLDELRPGNAPEALKEKFRNRPDEVCYIAEDGGKVIGFVMYLNYWLKDKERLGPEYGNINEILVKDGYKGTDVAYTLLKMALNDLINAGKTKITMTVQQDNPNRFLHFALADKLLDMQTCKRKNGSVTVSYDLLISDATKIKELSFLEIGKRAAKIRRKTNEENIKDPIFIQE